MMKRAILIIIMMISTLGLYSFKYNTNDAKTSFASFYHDKFNGRKTASGEVFDNSKTNCCKYENYHLERKVKLLT